jgi:hypothetical protein
LAGEAGAVQLLFIKITSNNMYHLVVVLFFLSFVVPGSSLVPGRRNKESKNTHMINIIYCYYYYLLAVAVVVIVIVIIVVVVVRVSE